MFFLIFFSSASYSKNIASEKKIEIILPPFQSQKPVFHSKNIASEKKIEICSSYSMGKEIYNSKNIASEKKIEILFFPDF